MTTSLPRLFGPFCLVLCAQAVAEDNIASLPYRNASLSVDQRAADVVSRMTLEEKAHQLGHTAPAIPRLGVPEYNWWNEGLHGVARAGVATVFPQAIGMAATWDEALIKKTADVISTEFRAKYVAHVRPNGGTDWYRGLTVWSPNINIFRDPRWGRGQETYGEDPFLTSRIGVAFIQGLQGDDPRYLKTVATSKHFAVHSGPESNRHREDVHPSAHDLHDTYLPAFRATVTEGKVESIMCAYNAVNGIPACANTKLMGQYLRNDWGFKGYVVSDCGAAANIFRKDSLHYKPTAAEGVAAGFKAGMDLICGDYRNDMSTEPEGIVSAVKQGLLPEDVIDESLRRLFSARIRLGMFDPPGKVPYSKITKADNDTAAHRALALQVAKASMVLLKNAGGLLPLKKAPATIAVVGPNADSLDALLGNYNGTPSKPVTVLAGIRARFPQSKIIYAEGTGLIGPATTPVPGTARRLPSQRGDDAVVAARNADLVVFVAGLSARVEGEEMKIEAPGFAGGDRTSLDLPGPQQQLLKRVHAVGKPVVLVLMNGSALGVNWADENIPAIVEAWYPGGEGGTAVASLLAGDYSPAGRLPVTFYKSVDQLPPFSDYSMARRTYRYFDGEPLYPFGYGLSYTTFRYENARTSSSSIAADAAVTVSVDVTNTGPMAGDEVVQLYVTHPEVKGAPIRSLKGFQRIHLEKGATKTVQFTLADRALSIVDAAGIRRIEPGKIELWIGAGQPVVRTGMPAPAGAKTQFTVTGSATLPN